MQSALPYPSGASGGLLRPGPRNPSDQSLRTPTTGNKKSALEQSSTPNSTGSRWQQQTPGQEAPSAPAAAVRPQPPRSQQYLRPQRPTRSLDDYQWSPTRELLSEPQKSLHEVVRTATRLSSKQRTATQVLGIFSSTLSASARQPSPTSSSIAAALQTAANVAAEQRLPQSMRQQAMGESTQAAVSNSFQTEDEWLQQQQQQQQQQLAVLPADAGERRQLQLQQQQQHCVDALRVQQDPSQQTEGSQDQQSPHLHDYKQHEVQQPQCETPVVAEQSAAAAAAQ